MMSVRSRGSARRRLLSSGNYGSESVMDSGLDVNYQGGQMPEKHASNMRSRETSIMESSSTIRSHRNRREIYNPYLQPCRTPQGERHSPQLTRGRTTSQSERNVLSSRPPELNNERVPK